MVFFSFYNFGRLRRSEPFFQQTVHSKQPNTFASTFASKHRASVPRASPWCSVHRLFVLSTIASPGGTRCDPLGRTRHGPTGRSPGAPAFCAAPPEPGDTGTENRIYTGPDRPIVNRNRQPFYLTSRICTQHRHPPV